MAPMECVWIIGKFVSGHFCGGVFNGKIVSKINFKAGGLFSL